MVKGLVNATLGMDGEPVWASNGNPAALSGRLCNFCWWYHQQGCNGPNSTNPYAKLVYLVTTSKPTTLTLTQIQPNVYQYNNQVFYPVDGLGWNAAGMGTPQTNADCNVNNSVGTTSRSADALRVHVLVGLVADVHVHRRRRRAGVINGRLAVDLGGVHGATNGTVTLNAATAYHLGLVNGGMYSIDLFTGRAPHLPSRRTR